MSAIAVGSFDLIANFPSQYQRQELRIETGDLLVRTGREKIESQMPLVLWQVKSSGTQLRATAALTIRVRSEGNFVFAENETLRVFAHGQSLDEALEQFQDHVVHFYESYLKLGNDQVIGEGARLKQVFEASFQRG